MNSQFSKKNYHERVLNFVKCFCKIYWDDIIFLYFLLIIGNTLIGFSMSNQPSLPGITSINHKMVAFLCIYWIYFQYTFLFLKFIGLSKLVYKLFSCNVFITFKYQEFSQKYYIFFYFSVCKKCWLVSFIPSLLNRIQ